MKIALAFFVCLAACWISPAKTIAGDLPRICTDAQAVYDNAHAYSNDSHFSEWNLDLLLKAEKAFEACWKHSNDSHAIAYGAFGEIRSFRDLAIYSFGNARYAKIKAKGDDNAGRKRFTSYRATGLEAVEYATRLINSMNNSNGVYDDEEFQELDSIYSSVKVVHGIGAALTYERTPRTDAEDLSRIAAEDARPSTRKPAPESPQTQPTKKKLTCDVPNADPSTIKAVSPNYPDIARQQGAVGTTKVRVTLDADGHVLDASVSTSSGNASLDQAAVIAARASTFSPSVVNCVNTASSYLFSADFNGNY